MTAAAAGATVGAMRDLFLLGARSVQTALAAPAVADRWDEPSILADQSIGGLAGHLARGGVWVVDDYLDAGVPDVATIPDAAVYFASVADMDEAGHEAIRQRGVAVAAVGPDALRSQLATRLDALEARLATEPVERLVSVFGGTMRLDDYLLTRLVEQVVHLDDLARSLGEERSQAPEDLAAVVAGIGVAIAVARHGATAAVRLLFRDAPDGVVPVLS